MRPELDSKLCEKYPAIFQDRYADMQQTAMCWGFECSDGWYQLLDNLCSDLTRIGIDVKATQVKEKFGTLRFYTEYRGADEQLCRIADAIISAAEHRSGQICEECGDWGWTNSEGWLTTRCKKHKKADECVDV